MPGRSASPPKLVTSASTSGIAIGWSTTRSMGSLSGSVKVLDFAVMDEIVIEVRSPGSLVVAKATRRRVGDAQRVETALATFMYTAHKVRDCVARSQNLLESAAAVLPPGLRQ